MRLIKNENDIETSTVFVIINIASHRICIAGIFYSNAEGAEDHFDIVLNKHSTYLLTSKGDLTGAQIRASKRVSVFGGNVRAKVDGK